MDANLKPGASREQSLLAFVADLELEVDRLRTHLLYVQQAAVDASNRIRLLCRSAPEAPACVRIGAEVEALVEVVRDLRETPGYHPTHDQAVSIALRPLIEQTFRWQQRVLNAPFLGLRMELEEEAVVWFPGRLRHILNNLISNAVKYRDPQKGEMRLTFTLKCLSADYELRLTDNGLGLRPNQAAENLALFHRSSPARSATTGVGLSVVRVLIEQSGGSLEIESHEGQGASVKAILPRFDVDDFIG